MKNREFSTSKGDFLIVEFPQGVVPRRGDIIVRTWVLPTLPEGRWMHICRGDDIDEEKAKYVVEEVRFRIGGSVEVYYKDYIKHSSATTFTALESLNSLFESIGVLWENPLGRSPLATDDDAGTDKEFDQRDWNNAQQNVFDKSRTYLFRKVSL